MAEEKSMGRELGGIWRRRKEIWRLVTRTDKLGLTAGVVIMALVAALETGIAILIGWFFNRVAAFAGRPISEWKQVVFVSLAILAAAYLFKESLNFLRRWIVTRTTTAIDRRM